MACNPVTPPASTLRTPSFNPWRVFSWLATLAVPQRTYIGCGFNPWRVFSWLATPCLAPQAEHSTPVSIPGGFFRGLQPTLAGGADDILEEFQSLAGFFVACNSPRSRLRAWLTSFNPWRVFSWLATGYPLRSGGASQTVSIPGGFFRGLQHGLTRRNMTWLDRFQSLAGFFVACNPETETGRGPSRISFNPWRVFSWLATSGKPRIRAAGRMVSIPGGFFRGLQRFRTRGCLI